MVDDRLTCAASPVSHPEACLAGGGELGALTRSVDWSATPLGAVASWPQSLRTALSMMLESRFAMVVAWGPEFRFFYNDRYVPVLGEKHPHALGTPASEIFPEVWHLIGPEFRRVRDGDAFALDDWYLPLERSGYRENCWFTVSYSAIRDESGGVGGLLAVVAETTERVEGERRLATLRELAAFAAEARTPEQACTNAALAFAHNPIDVPFAIVYALDDDGVTARRLAHVGLPDDHPAAPAVLAPGASPWPLVDAPLVLGDLRARFGELPGGPAPEPTHAAILLPLVRPGLAHPYGMLVAGISPRRALDDRYRGFFELAADQIATAIGNGRALEEQRKRAEQLAELDRAKTAFFSNVSHEFRTPLALMLGPLEDLLAGRHGPVSPELHVQHELVHRNALRLHKLVNAMLDFSRIEAGRARAAYEPTDLASATVELASMFRSAIERAGLELVVDCAPLPEPVFVDRQMWETIVLNLLSNAFKFTFEGRITIALRHAGDHVELAVADTGCGIPADELARVFERFHRVDRARARTLEGTGIGLALALELARLHGGGIAVASELGAGTTFTVRIRTGRAHLPAEHVVPAPRGPAFAAAYVEEAKRWLPDAAPAPQPITGGARVLIADDNADMRDYLRHVLEPHWRVSAVADGASALAEIRRAPPDVVVSDVMMPGLDGFGLIAALRGDRATRDVPVIVVSARAGDEARAEGLEAGADDYLVKPFSARELVARVGTQLAAVATRRAEDARRADAELQRRELHALFMQAPTPMCILSGPHHVVELANASCCAVWRRTPADVVGRPLLDGLPDIANNGFEELLDSVYETGVPVTGKEWLATLDGHDTFFNFVYAPKRDVDGVIEGVLVLAFDVTDEVRARRELARTIEFNEKFTALLGHDLRNPLNAIATTAQLLQRRASTVDIATPATRIVESSERMACMIAQLLDVARMRVAGGLQLQPTRLDLGELCRLVVDELREVHPLTRLEIETTGSLHGSWDAERIAEVVTNLARNAIDHGPTSAPIRIEVDGRDHDRIAIRIASSGEIAPRVLPTLFDPFVHRRGDKTRGLGLGLYIAKEIVTAHRGTIAVHSSPLAGTRFEIDLPKEAAS